MPLATAMSEKPSPDHNVPMERFRHSLKVEEAHGQHFVPRVEANHCVCSLIFKGFTIRHGNTTRMYSSRDYQLPIKSEREVIERANAATDEVLLQNSQTAQQAKRAD